MKLWIVFQTLLQKTFVSDAKFPYVFASLTFCLQRQRKSDRLVESSIHLLATQTTSIYLLVLPRFFVFGNAQPRMTHVRASAHNQLVTKGPPQAGHNHLLPVGFRPRPPEFFIFHTVVVRISKIGFLHHAILLKSRTTALHCRLYQRTYQLDLRMFGIIT